MGKGFFKVVRKNSPNAFQSVCTWIERYVAGAHMKGMCECGGKEILCKKKKKGNCHVWGVREVFCFMNACVR